MAQLKLKEQATMNSTGMKNWIMPTTWMWLKLDKSLLESPDKKKKKFLLTLWFQDFSDFKQRI